MEYYLRIEGVNLDAVLFDTPQISVARGASFLLRKLTQELPSLITNEWQLDTKLEPISIGASIGLYSFSSHSETIVNTLPSSIQAFLKQHPDYKYFTFVVDAIASNGTNNFRSDLETLISANRYQQMFSPSLSIEAIGIESNTYCACNGILPADGKLKIGRIEGYVSPSTKQRYEQGRALRQSFYQTEAGEEFSKSNGYHFTNSLEQLSDNPEKRNLHNKIALIYLDGNKFGKLQKNECQTKESQKLFDSTVQNYRSKYLANFLQTIKSNKDYQYVDESGETRLRLEILIWGGDEILLVVPAWCGLHALGLFYEQSQNWSFKNIPLTHAGGVVFANHKTPIQKLKKIASDLAQEIKDFGKESELNGFDYLVLESLNCPSTEISEIREMVFGSRISTSRTLLSPVSLHQLSEANTIKIIPKSQLYKIAHTILNESNLESADSSEQLGQKSRASIERMLEVAKDLNVKAVQQNISNLFIPFNLNISPENHIWPWLHLTELWDYLLPIAETNEKEVI